MQCAVPRRSQEALLPNCKALKVSSNKVSTAVCLWKLYGYQGPPRWTHGTALTDEIQVGFEVIKAVVNLNPGENIHFSCFKVDVPRCSGVAEQDLPRSARLHRILFQPTGIPLRLGFVATTARSCNSSGNQLWTTSSSRRYLWFLHPGWAVYSFSPSIWGVVIGQRCCGHALVRVPSGNLTLQSLVILIHLPCLPYAPNFFGSTCRARANRQTILIVWVLRTHGGGAMGSYSIRRRAFQPSFSICHSAQSPLFLLRKYYS